MTYSSTLSLTVSKDGVGGQLHIPGRFNHGKVTRYPLYSRMGRPQGRSEQMRKISLPSVFDPRTVDPVARRYTDWAIPAHTQETVHHLIGPNRFNPSVTLGLQFKLLPMMEGYQIYRRM
jgi:hypothetical protein